MPIADAPYIQYMQAEGEPQKDPRLFDYTKSDSVEPKNSNLSNGLQGVYQRSPDATLV